MSNYLLITSGHIDNEEKIKDYIKSFETVSIISKYFDEVFIIECCSKEKVYYLEDTNFKVYYSPLYNTHSNKGYNQFKHVQNFLKSTDLIHNQSNIIMMTGRYYVTSDSFIKIALELLNSNKNIVAKTDQDLYPGAPGVHTFYIGYTKEAFLNFFHWYNVHGNQHICIEWEVKNYMNKHPEGSVILPQDTKMGIIVNQVYGEKGKCI